MSEKKSIDITQVICIAFGILVGMLIAQLVLGFGGVLGGAWAEA